MARAGLHHTRTLLPPLFTEPCAAVMRVTACACVVLLVSSATNTLQAQQGPIHYFQRADLPPGSIGCAQLQRGGPLLGHFQSVTISAPEGAHLSLASEGVFEPPQAEPLKAGLLIGNVYRLKVTNIPFHEGYEVFPSIEIINRLYPPAGLETKFTIPIELTQEELEMALRGHFVIRVIYLEDPDNALPEREDPQHQRYYEVRADQDPLRIADGLGRPMAILRLGSRVPELDQVS